MAADNRLENDPLRVESYSVSLLVSKSLQCKSAGYFTANFHQIYACVRTATGDPLGAQAHTEVSVTLAAHRQQFRLYMVDRGKVFERWNRQWLPSGNCFRQHSFQTVRFAGYQDHEPDFAGSGISHVSSS